MSTLKTNIKSYRKKFGMNQSELAELVGVRLETKCFFILLYELINRLVSKYKKYKLNTITKILALSPAPKKLIDQKQDQIYQKFLKIC